MSGEKESTRLNERQRAVLGQIADYGRANGFSDAQIRIAVKTAFIESSLGDNLGPNPKGTASGLFGYIDASWKKSYGKKSNNSDQIKAFYNDLAEYSWRYDAQPYGPIPKKDVSLEEYVYIKHHDGRSKPPSANSVGKRLWNEKPFEVPIERSGPRSSVVPRSTMPAAPRNTLAPEASLSGDVASFPSPYATPFTAVGNPSFSAGTVLSGSSLPPFPRRNLLAPAPQSFEKGYSPFGGQQEEYDFFPPTV